MDSILNTVKASIGIVEDYTAFDDTLIMHINSVFMVLRQMGVGPVEGFKIENKGATWSEFIPSENYLYEGVKTYVCSKVRLMFDPPSSGSLMEALKQTISEFEWRVYWESDLSFN